jgi:serine/threonine protein kinase
MDDNAVHSSMANMNPRWVAPEIMDGKGASSACDVYSFGVVMWELLTWELPFENVNTWMVRGIEVVCSAGLQLRALGGGCPPPHCMSASGGLGVSQLRLHYMSFTI